ncbi:PDZ domain-containing protein [Alkalibacillus aidingensis]|uniref:hypothetical protein n=1 Tax=Alkalibacillus aidingensis TaxID=2747607 RepID=UPI00166032A9|nr:hypothetical protein [Alkalibacillus aidingensis]
MWLDWLQELGFGLLWLFAQPILYAAIALSFWTGYLRIKADRQQIGHRVFPLHAEWKGTWLWGLLFGLILSVAFVAVGVILTWEWLLLWSAVTIVLMASHQVYLLSPAYTLGLTIIAVWAIDFWNLTVINSDVTTSILQVESVSSIYLMLALLLAEFVLIYTTKRSNTFPQLKKGDRGKYIGIHHAKRLMLIPLLVPLPFGTVTLNEYLFWWPMFGSEGSGMSFVLFPYIIGFSQRFQGMYSDTGARRVAWYVLGVTILLIGGATITYGEPILSLSLVVIAIGARILIQLLTRYFDQEKRPVYTPEVDGITVVGVVPGSPADDMGLIIGEKIERVHDVPVTNEYEFYDVLSDNRTYCKLNVRDLNGEIRFVQRPLYEGEDHELGLIFVKETPRFTLQSETISLDGN